MALRESCLQAGLDVRMDEFGYVAAVLGNFPHETRRNEVVMLVRRQKHGLDLRRKVSVHRRKLKFELEVRNRPQTANDCAEIVPEGEIHRQAAMIGYLNAFGLFTLASVIVLPLILLVKVPKLGDTP